MIHIPFNRPYATGKEIDYIRAAITTPKLAGDGGFTARCHQLIEQSLGIQKALLTTSCTHALEMAALLLDLRTGDDIIVPAFTFPSALNAFVLRGAKPVFVDVRPDTLNIDETQMEQRITELQTHSTLMRPKWSNALPNARRRFSWCITLASDAKWRS